MFSYSDGTHGHGDFNDWDNLDFGFFQTKENRAICFQTKNK